MIKIRIQVTGRSAQGTAVVLEERVTEIPVPALDEREQRSLLDPMALWAESLKDNLEGKLREVGLAR